MEIKILIVDDNDIFNKILCKKVNTLLDFLKLDNVDFKVFSAKEPQEAEDIIKAEKPHIGILDYLIENFNGDRRTGVELLISMLEENENSKVVMISREHDNEVIQEAKELGAKHFISKENQLKAMGLLDVALREFIDQLID